MNMLTLETIFKSKYKEMVKYAAHFVGNDDAEDVIQRLYIKLHLKNHPIEMIESLLFLIIKRECFNYNDHMKRKRRKIKLVGVRLEFVDHGTVTIDPFKYQNALSLTNTLPTIRGKCFRLYYLDEMSCPEIARTIGNTSSTVRGHLSEGRKMLKEKLNIK